MTRKLGARLFKSPKTSKVYFDPQKSINAPRYNVDLGNLLAFDLQAHLGISKE